MEKHLKTTTNTFTGLIKVHWQPSIFLLAFLSWPFVIEFICRLSAFLPLLSLLSQHAQQLCEYI